ncbi:cytochrome P450 hydroxylase [Cystobacter fuscus]|uniref:Cytochrome P450 hydroxylase n=1 Tax=Cystobacter fuscus TaxID=43 RepID=A0A250IW39_9BACT|nr:cytochrome P450 [Cystobacter fuscus]ATB35949.1 cytochrome P450 hydroxylase [Cystobacter fuscus]
MTTQRVNILAPEFRADPHPRYAELRRNAPVTQVEPAGFWAISRYEDVAFVIKNPQLFSSQGFKAAWQPEWVGYNPLANSMLVLDGVGHARMRTLVSRAFNASAISRLEVRIRQLANRLVDELAEKGEADAVSSFAMPLPAFVIGELLGLDVSLHHRFKDWSDDITSVTPVPHNPEHAQRTLTAITDATRYISEIIEARRRSPADDLVSDLIHAEVEGQSLTDREIVDFLVLLLIAGLETTVHLLAHSLLFLAERPEEQARLRAQPALVPGFVEEMLRYEAPVQALLRVATSDVTLSGVKIPQGDVVLALLASANRDERHYTEPDRFDVHRGQPGLSFGYGIHYCIGAQLARMEARCGLEALLSRFSGFTRTSTELSWGQAITVRGPQHLPLRFIPA